MREQGGSGCDAPKLRISVEPSFVRRHRHAQSLLSPDSPGNNDACEATQFEQMRWASKGGGMRHSSLSTPRRFCSSWRGSGPGMWEQWRAG